MKDKHDTFDFLKANKIARISRGIRLSSTERNNLKNNFHTFLTTTPIPPSRFSNALFYLAQHKTLVLCSIFFFVASYTAALAESALPGDILYPIKTDVNEKVLTTLALTASAKVKANTELANRRLDEFEKVVVKKPEKKVLEDISSKLDEHSNAIETTVVDTSQDQNIEKADVAKEVDTFESILETHKKNLDTLDKIDSKDPELDKELKKQKKQIETKLDKIEKLVKKYLKEKDKENTTSATSTSEIQSGTTTLPEQIGTTTATSSEEVSHASTSTATSTQNNMAGTTTQNQTATTTNSK